MFTGRFAFSPKADVGLLNDGAGLEERLRWLRPRSRPALDLPVTRVGDPAWSRDGRRVAVGGIPRSAGHDSPTSDSPWALYLLDRRGRLLRRLPVDLRDGADASWSPDGRWLAVRTRPAGRAYGVWLIGVSASVAPRLLVAGHAFGIPKWIASREIVVPVGTAGSIALGYRGRVGLYVLRLPRI
jgi:dipeptidyl aminopeptidase/acylaminoacyl peptidase